MRKFDEHKLKNDLACLPPAFRVAFAAAGAERQMPAYRAFARDSGFGDAQILDSALLDAWSNPGPGEPAEIERQYEECRALIPNDQDFQPWSNAANHAQDAAISVAYTVRTRLAGDPQEAAWSASHAWESLYQFVIDREEPDVNRPEEMARVLVHPLVQAELARQERDLAELLRADIRHPALMTARLRDRAVLESSSFFATGTPRPL